MLKSTLEELFPDSVPLKRRRLSANDILFRQGDAAHSLFGLESGQVRLERYTPEGRGAIMHVAKPQECFAEASLFSNQYHCDAVATQPSMVVVYPKEAVLMAIRENPDVAIGYVGYLSSQVRTLRAHLELRSILSARERMTQYLLVFSSPDTRTLHLQGTLKDLASQLGLAHETVYRELKKMEEEGLIERSGNRIVVGKII